MLLSPVAMHIPDGFLSVAVALICWLASASAIAIALRNVSKDLGERQVPLMGVLAAAIFAGQMLNFTVAGGTSGHLMGAAIATILLGPWAAVVVLTCVLGVQALVFQDGGLLALGANIFNMGLVGVAVSYAVYRLAQKISSGRSWGIFAGGFASAWMSIEIASLAVGLELAFSGTSPANIALPAMAGIHGLIGIGEGLITLGVLAFIYASRRDLLLGDRVSVRGGRLVWGAGLVIVLALAVAAPLASSHPDGLEWVAAQKGFLAAAQRPVFTMIPDYIFPGVADSAFATVLAAVLGALLVFSVALAVTYARRKRQVR